MSVAESIYEDDAEQYEDGDGEVAEDEGLAGRSQRSRGSRRVSLAASVPESVSYQPSRLTARAQPSTMSIDESILSERAPSRSAMRQVGTRAQGSAYLCLAELHLQLGKQRPCRYMSLPYVRKRTIPPACADVLLQVSGLSVPESLYEEDEEDASARKRRPRGVAQQVSTVSIADTVQSVPYSSAPGGYSRDLSSVQESLAGVSGRSRPAPSAASSRRRRRSTAADTVGTSEPGYSMQFDEDEVEGEEYEEDYTSPGTSRSPSRVTSRAVTGGGRTRSGTVSTESAGMATEEPSYEVEDEAGLTVSGSSVRPHQQQQQPQRPGSAPVAANGRKGGSGGGAPGAQRPSSAAPGVGRLAATVDPTASPLALRASMDGKRDTQKHTPPRIHTVYLMWLEPSVRRANNASWPTLLTDCLLFPQRRWVGAGRRHDGVVRCGRGGPHAAGAGPADRPAAGAGGQRRVQDGGAGGAAGGGDPAAAPAGHHPGAALGAGARTIADIGVP